MLGDTVHYTGNILIFWVSHRAASSSAFHFLTLLLQRRNDSAVVFSLSAFDDLWASFSSGCHLFYSLMLSKAEARVKKILLVGLMQNQIATKNVWTCYKIYTALLESLNLGVFVCYCGSVNNMNRTRNIPKWILNISKINLDQFGCVYWEIFGSAH